MSKMINDTDTSSKKDDSVHSTKHIVVTLVGTAVAVILAVIVLFEIFTGIKNEYFTIKSNSEYKYCSQVMNTIQALYQSGYSDEDIVDYLNNNMDTSASSWMFYIKNGTVLYAKNEQTTENLDELKYINPFMDHLESQDALITTSNITINNDEYVVGIIEDRNQLLVDANVKSYGIYILLLFAAIILTGTASVIALAGAWVSSEKKRKHVDNVLKARNETFDKAFNNLTNEKKMQLTEIDSQGEMNLYKQYKFKFYLNARHAIYIDGIQGTMHPHTWEITLNVIKKEKNFIEFNKIEKKIDEYINKFQDKDLNSIEPFDTINPTLENCCDYFKFNLENILNEEGFELLMMEMSETPSRSYVISQLDDTQI